MNIAKNGKPEVAIIEYEIAVKALEIIMDSNKKFPNTANILTNITYTHYSKQLQLAARYFDLNHVKVTPHGAILGRAVENFNNRVPLDDIAVVGRWTAIDSAVSYIDNWKASLINVNMSPFSESEIIREAENFRNMILSNRGNLRKKERVEIITIQN